MTSNPGAIHESLMAEAHAAAAACGVTRLADVTGLDRIGMPVFQAMRPASRALTVHQGKGLTPAQARIGALMEAIESAHAEGFGDCAQVCSYEDLPADQRPGCLADFARDRAAVVGQDEPIAWARAGRLTDDRAILVPFDSVSLDFVSPWDRRLDHTSNGLGARFDAEGAVLKGLLEVVERDAVLVWRARPMALRATRQIDRDTILHGWFRDLAERLAGARISLSIYSLPTLAGLTTIRAELREPGAEPRASGLAGGAACATDPEDALRGAVLEALQSRLALIAGSRDDILYRADAAVRLGDACPLPPDIQGLDWERIAVAAERPADTAWRIADRLAAAGYAGSCAVQLSDPAARVCVVKVFAPGLAANARSRRPPS